MSEFCDDAEVISGYSRKQAIEDGVLVDLTANGETKLLLHDAGFKAPVAMTTGAFRKTVLAGTTGTPDGQFVFPGGQSLKGRLWDVLFVLSMTARSQRGRQSDRVHFQVDVDAAGDGKRETVSLWAMLGPSDNGEPVMTIMLEGED
jgi:hypothetical protein